jgi:hypothetical protein
LRKSLEFEPYSGTAHFYRGFVLLNKEDYESAIAEFTKALGWTGGMTAWAAEMIGCAAALSGDRKLALRILQETKEKSERGYLPTSGLAWIYSGLWNKKKTLDLLAKALEEHDAVLPWLKCFPDYDWLRTDPRFQDLLGKHRLSS